MTNLCLVAVNSAWYQSNPALYYLRGTLRGLPYKVRILDFTNSEPIGDVLASIYRCKPAVLCFSVYVWNRSFLQALIPGLRKLLPEVRIVLGGPEASPEGFGLDSADYVIKGPGEGAFRLLAESGFTLPGGVYTALAPQLRDLPFPYRMADKPALQDRLIYYETSRGCPFRCVYCLSANDLRNETRFDPANAADRRRLYRELDKLVALQPRTLKFVDRSFNIHPRLARLIWDYAIRRELPCEFHFEIYPDLLTEEDIILLEKVPPGRIRFEIGIQTVNPAVSRNCRRNSNWTKAKAMLQALRQRTNICIHADLLAGLPGESLRSVLHSIDELAPLLPHEIQLGQLKILPDTPMHELAAQLGYLWMSEPPYQILSSDKLSFAQVTHLQGLARILNLYWNKGEFSAEWSVLLSSGQPASALLQKLLAYHRQHDLPLHSISKQHRKEVFEAVFHIASF